MYRKVNSFGRVLKLLKGVVVEVVLADRERALRQVFE